MLPVNLCGSSSSVQGENGDAHPNTVSLDNAAEIVLDLNREHEVGSFTLHPVGKGGCVRYNCQGLSSRPRCQQSRGHPQTRCFCLRSASQPRLLSRLGDR